MTLFLSFVALLPRLLLGFCIVHFIWGAMDGKSLFVKVFLSAGIGFGISSLFGFLWIWLGLPLTVYVILESAVAVALTGWIFYKNRTEFHIPKMTDKTNFIWGLILPVSVL